VLPPPSVTDIGALSVTDNKEQVPRLTKNEGDARARLQRTALELFRERGYDQTTAAEIAARAGVTERTFFRHFADKREVLFDGEAKLRVALTASIADAPAGLGPLDTLFRAFRSLQPMIEDNRPFSKPRQEVISTTPALHERELAKMAALADALAVALKARGVADLQAVLAARTGMAAFVHATISWLDDPKLGLGERLDLAYRGLKALLTENDP
jgi:AcrR family transcriptional regulator